MLKFEVKCQTSSKAFNISILVFKRRDQPYFSATHGRLMFITENGQHNLRRDDTSTHSKEVSTLVSQK